MQTKELAKRNIEIGKKYSPDEADIFDVAVAALFYDMNDRKGFDTGNIPDDIVEDWKEVWRETLRQLFV